MRDAELNERLSVDNKRIAMIYRQMVFLDTRLQAFESVFTRKKTLLATLFNPRGTMRRVNALHLELMKKHDDEMRGESERQKARMKLITPNGINLNAI